MSQQAYNTHDAAAKIPTGNTVLNGVEKDYLDVKVVKVRGDDD